MIRKLLNLFVLPMALLVLGLATLDATVAFVETSSNNAKEIELQSRLNSVLADLIEVGNVSREQIVLDKNATAYNHAVLFLCIYVAVAAITLIHAILDPQAVLRYTLLAIQTISLFLGLLTPAIVVSAVETLPILGNISLYFNAKSVSATCLELLTNQSTLVLAVLILIPAIIIPFTKLSFAWSSLFFSTSLGSRFNSVFDRFASVDVCVISWLLAFLATSYSQVVDTLALPGAYFYGVYAVAVVLGNTITDKQT